jgi:hypothetical protein
MMIRPYKSKSYDLLEGFARFLILCLKGREDAVMARHSGEKSTKECNRGKP